MMPTKTIYTALAAGALSAMLVARHSNSMHADRFIAQDVAIMMGGMLLGGVLLNGLEDRDSIGRGLLWGAGSLGSTFVVDRALSR